MELRQQVARTVLALVVLAAPTAAFARHARPLYHENEAAEQALQHKIADTHAKIADIKRTSAVTPPSQP